MATILSVPTLKSVIDCADFSLTVKPYVPQLVELPNKVVSILSSESKLQDLTQLYLNTNPLIFAFAFALLLSPVVLIVAEINGNYSQVDRLWSLLPTVYIGHYTAWAHANGLPTQRLDNVLVFSAVWSARLTFNYWRKGGYSIGSEDYRWEIIGKKIGRLGMVLLNITFISFGQSVLLFLVSAPAYLIMLASRVGSSKMQIADVAFSRTLLGLILIEFFADQQQWDYHQAKRKYLATAKIPPTSKFTQEDLDRGFNVSGLWSWSRHPNFLAEQSIWVLVYAWAGYATETYLNWTIAGALGYLAIFQGSTWLTELITAGKYPEYAEYQRLVGRFFPRILPPKAENPPNNVGKKSVVAKKGKKKD